MRQIANHGIGADDSAQTNGATQMQVTVPASEAKLGDGGYDRYEELRAEARHIVDVIERDSHKNSTDFAAQIEAIARQGERSGDKATHAGDKAAAAASQVGDAVVASARASALGFADQTKWITSEVREAVEASTEGFQATQLALVSGFKDGRFDAANYAKDSALEASKNSSAGQLEAAKNFYALTVQATANAAASTLLATQLAAQASKEAADCCCELRERIAAEGEKTRGLIERNTIDGLREKNVMLARMIPVTVPVGT